MKFLLFTIAWLFSWGVAMAQQLPAWVTTPPKSDQALRRSLSSGATLSDARSTALNYLIGMASFTPQEGSYQQKRLEAGKEKYDQHVALLEAAKNSAFFKTEQTFETDSLCWVLCSIAETDLQAFVDSIYASVLQEAQLLKVKGQQLRLEGDVLAAASSYAEAVRTLVPVIHLPLNDVDGADLMDGLQADFIHVLDSLTWQWERDSCFMVKDEDLPLPLYATATINGKSVPGLPAYFGLTPEGQLASEEMTDEQGRVKTHVTKAPNAETAELVVGLNQERLPMLPRNLFLDELNVRIGQDADCASLHLVAFDPDPLFYSALSPVDVRAIGDSIYAVMQRYGYKSIDLESESDIILQLEFIATPMEEPKTKFRFQDMACEIILRIVDRRTEEVLEQVDVNCLPQPRMEKTSDEKFREEALKDNFGVFRLRFIRTVRDELNFDKRSLMFAS